jgi:hypothetical protein
MLKGAIRRLRGRRKMNLDPAGPVVGMRLIFRAEIMPGRETHERTYEVTGVLASGRIVLANLHGEHAITEFEPLPVCG